MLKNAFVRRVILDLGETVWTLRKRSEMSSRLTVDQEVGGSSPPSCTIAKSIT